MKTCIASHQSPGKNTIFSVRYPFFRTKTPDTPPDKIKTFYLAKRIKLNSIRNSHNQLSLFCQPDNKNTSFRQTKTPNVNYLLSHNK
jgi:hypothetical protein